MPGSLKGLRLDLAAETELQASVSYYRWRGGENLAARFKQEVAAALTSVASAPELFAFVPELEGVQKVRLRRFPFSILFVNRPDHIWIVAIAHGSRKPRYWRERL